MNVAFRIVPGLACLSLLAPAFAADVPELGRLFFTPERRVPLVPGPAPSLSISKPCLIDTI